MDWLTGYDFDLPDAAIARRPAEPRDSSRLLVFDRESGTRTQSVFRDLPRFLRAGDLLVRNETRVLRARVYTRLARTGRPVEVLFSHPDGASWIALLGPGRRLKPGDRLVPELPEGAVSNAGPLPDLVLEAPVGGGLWRLQADGGPVESLMECAGHIPLPPYLHREDSPADAEWYQTIYADAGGAVAAPTAGLHFTAGTFADLAATGVGVARVILHVGPGTFLPVRAEREEEHRVLPERFEVPEATARAIAETRAAGGRVVAVGTTTVRALESAAVQGTKEAPGDGVGGGRIVRDGGFTGERIIPEGGFGGDRTVPTGAGWADLTIVPGHRFRSVDALVTNFHLPRSSLLLLVAAFAGRERILSAYVEARDAGYRFYSYGDAMLIL